MFLKEFAGKCEWEFYGALLTFPLDAKRFSRFAFALLNVALICFSKETSVEFNLFELYSKTDVEKENVSEFRKRTLPSV